MPDQVMDESHSRSCLDRAIGKRHVQKEAVLEDVCRGTSCAAVLLDEQVTNENDPAEPRTPQKPIRIQTQFARDEGRNPRNVGFGWILGGATTLFVVVATNPAANAFLSSFFLAMHGLVRVESNQCNLTQHR
jgi:hypothetical protein